MKQTESKYQCIPFWSWNDELTEEGLVKQVEWMHEQGVGGFFMHARGGLKTEYLGEQWFKCIEACSKKAQELGMEAYAYDENGWPSGFVGGKLLDDIENHDKYLTVSYGPYDEKAMASYDLSKDGLCRTTSGDNCLNVFENYAASTADILNGEVVDKFIAMTHEEYKKRDTYELKGFFTDEPQYYRWGTPYTKVMKEYFKEVYGEDILDGIGYLFVEKEGYRAFRYKYWKAMQALMLKNFAKKVYDWCDGNNYKLTGHYVEETSLGAQMWCCGGAMPFYEYEHIPGIDWLGRGIGNELSPKQVSSVAQQLGKKQVITETYGCCGWDVTPLELKWIAEFQYVHGVNLMCQHLLPYTEHGQRKRDYPAHYSMINPWVKKNFREFNDYFSVLGKTLAESEENVNVGILHPIRSTYFGYYRDQEETGMGILELEEALAKHIELFGAKQIPHHYLDETLLAKYGKVEGKKLVLGNCAYEYVVLPKIYTMDKTTEALLREFVQVGGKLLLLDEKPEYLEGEKFDYDYLISNVTLDEITAAEAVAEEHEFVRTAYRTSDDGKKFIYAMNRGGETTIKFRLKEGQCFKAYDILKDCYYTLPAEVRFDEWQSYLLYIEEGEGEAQKQLKPLKLGDKFTVVNTPDNYITLDFVKFSVDGKEYSESLHHMGVFNEMLQRRYKGKLYLKYEFTVEDIPEKCVLLAEDTNTVWVEFNGEKVEKQGVYEMEQCTFVYDIAKKIKKGKNEVVMLIDYYQSEQVYYALFGENVTESLKNCLAYDTDIEAVYLMGSFGVAGDFTQGREESILLGENFRLVKPKKEITSLIEEGYPFFAGDICLKQTVTVDDTALELVVDKRFQMLEVKVNGKYAGKMMFTKRLDLSDYLVKGENEIELILTVGNRNLYGAFHTPEQENFSVGPFTFERVGTWTNGKSSILRESYAFVKTIL